MSALSIAFVAESGPDVGLGHLSRCRALARAAAAQGARASFLVSGDPRAASLLDGAGHVQTLARPFDPDAARDGLRRLAPDVIVIDAYAASADFLASLRPLAQVVVVDDLADRRLPVDVVVNGSAAAEGLPYDRSSDTLLLLGPRYALLDPGFAAPPERAEGKGVTRALLSLGGSRQAGAMEAALTAVDRALRGCVVDVAAGPFGADLPAPAGAPGAGRNRIVVHRAGFGLRALMQEADVAISGAGVTLHELAATATPAVAIALAANQRPNLHAFARAGAALAAGEAGEAGLGGAIESALRRLAGDGALRSALGARARALVDGQGAARVAQAIGRAAVTRR